jgi:formate hydrogenlyase transcriptional activator
MKLYEQNCRERQFLLREVVSATASATNLRDAVCCLEALLPRLTDFERVVLFLKRPNDQRISCFSKDGYLDTSGLLPDEEHAVRQIVNRRENIFKPLLGRFHELQVDAPDITALPQKRTFDTSLLLPLQGLRSAAGVLGLYAKNGAPYSDRDRALFECLASLLGASFENILQRESFSNLETSLGRVNYQLGVSRFLARTAIETQTLQDLVVALSGEIYRAFETEILCLMTYRADSDDLYWSALNIPDGTGPTHIGRTTATGLSNGACVGLKTKKSFLADRSAIEQTAHENCISILLSQGAQTYFTVPLICEGRVVGVIAPAHVKRDSFSVEEIQLWEGFADQVSLAVVSLLRKQENQRLSLEVSRERMKAPHVVQRRNSFPDIVGDSEALKGVFAKTELVARTNSSVLIVGETGTGKDLIARAIHRLSERRDRPFVQINCASIPTTLLESEMFGHEKGAYTGAATKSIGRLQQANGGSLFMDEIGEMPLELQPKLLRAVQEQKFEPLGGSASVRVDVRFIWATNRDLGRMVLEKQFRSDLYYRLSVFPIVVPPLRDRAEDIPLLAHSFLCEFNRSMNKSIARIPSSSMDKLMARQWPGNVRELRNVIERSAILSHGSVLEVAAEDLTGVVVSGSVHGDVSPANSRWDDVEREYLLKVLRESDGVVAWAAERLHLRRTTLDSRLRRLGISAEELRALRRSVHK